MADTYTPRMRKRYDDVIVTTTARTDDEARELLKLFGFPFPIAAEEKAAA